MSAALVTGADSVGGAAAARSFVEAGWDVVTWSSSPSRVDETTHVRQKRLDLSDPRACRRASEDLSPDLDVVVHCALAEAEDLVAGWSDDEELVLNARLLAKVLDALGERRPHLLLLEGTKAYGSHVHPIPVPTRERLPRDPHHFYARQEDAAAAAGVDVTVVRTQLIVGGGTGTSTDPIAAIGAYIALCAALGLPCGFPGGPRYVWEAVDARVLGRMLVWAARDRAGTQGRVFNLTNGDVFTWADLWPALARTGGAEPGEAVATSLRQFFADHDADWRRIAARHRLRESSLRALVGTSDQAVDYYFGTGRDDVHDKLVSTIEVRRAGFAEWMDTSDSFIFWLRDLVARNYLPAFPRA
jgi:nucleoside-diphosphate-sugar epimerase